MTYHLNIIDGSVDLPKEIDITYDNLDVACDVLSEFVHRFDFIKRVDGRVCDEMDNDVDYSSSIFPPTTL